MSNLLSDWFDLESERLLRKGLTLSKKQAHEKIFSVDIDNDAYVGTICLWEPYKCEIQFNSCATGEVAYFKEEEVKSLFELDQFINQAFAALDFL